MSETVEHDLSYKVWLVSKKDGEVFLREHIASFCDKDEAKRYAEMFVEEENLNVEILT